MPVVNSIKRFNLNSKSLKEIKKLNLHNLSLKKIQGRNNFEYDSKIFKILNFKFKPKINFKIFFTENHISLELYDIKGIPQSLKKNITLNIRVDIYQDGKICKANRFISLSLKKDNLFLKFLSDEIVNKLSVNFLDAISERFDKKFLKEVLY